MKIPAVLFLFALLSAAIRAEEGLIPVEVFFITVPAANLKGVRVDVHVDRHRLAPQGITSINVFKTKLQPEPKNKVSLTESCEAWLKERGYSKVIREKSDVTKFEAETKEGRKLVSIHHGSNDSIDLDEVPRLKEALAQAAAAEAWYKLLLTARTLPEKTAEAHPPKAAGYRLQVTLGSVQGEGLEYEIALQRSDFVWKKPQLMEHRMLHVTHESERKTFIRLITGEWVKPMMEQVVLALEAVEQQKAFAFASTADGDGNTYTVTANGATLKADVVADTVGVGGKRVPYPCSFAVTQLAELRAVRAQSEAREKWFVEHEGWFFEKE